MRHVARAVFAAAIITGVTLTTTSCGTALATNAFSVTINDPGDRLGSGAIQVSVFDSQMGQSAEWAAKSMGTTSAGRPYTTSFKTATTKTVGDSSPAQQVDAGLAIPQYQPKGFFNIHVTPVDGKTLEVDAPFVGYYNYDPVKDGRVQTMRLKITCEAAELTWSLTIVALVPPKVIVEDPLPNPTS